MILKKLEIQGYGPFLDKTSLEIDPNVTVLTGSNDVGKSSILRLIQLLFSPSKETVEDDQNFDQKYNSQAAWNLDPEVYCRATFKLDETCRNYLAATNAAQGFEVDIGYRVTRQERTVENIRNGSSSVNIDNSHIHKLPSILYLPLEEEISYEFGFETANSIEKQFLSLAFGNNPKEKYTNSRTEFRTIALRQANRLIQEKLDKVLPYSTGLNLSIHPDDDDPFNFSLHFEDAQNGITTIRQRGTGIRKIVNLVVALVNIASTTEHIYILLDEPENSLHADSQHKLRGFLESIANNPKLHVIYATHSSSMINTLAPHNVRLLKRVSNDEGKATSRIDNHPYRENFLSVRTSLGISPSDSLLFGAVSIIIEGATESFCLPYVFKKLQDGNIAGFERALFLLSLAHFVSGGGTEYEYWCRFALNIGAKPILFLDGDKTSDYRKWKFDGKNVPAVLFPEELEFEDIVPHSYYVEAIGSFFELDGLTIEKYDSWYQSANLPEKMMFTKRITKWLKEEHSINERNFNKPAIMKKAIELTPIEEIRTQELLKLLNDISNEMGKL